MRLASGATLFFALVGSALAGTSGFADGKLRFAQAADACFANCANENASCKRVCPTTLSTPCLSACDSQMQTCKLSCQRR